MSRTCLFVLFTFVLLAFGHKGVTEPLLFDSKSASIEELDARCEAAREKLLAPLRKAEIERCKADKRNDPAFCERFWRDYGESRVDSDGVFVPREFSDIQECVVADRERHRRIRG